MKVATGQYYQTSWGDGQTQYDYLVVLSVSPSGKTATCQMIDPIHVGDTGQHHVFTPGGDRVGPVFQMRIKNGWGHGEFVLRGSYPYIPNHDGAARRLDTFRPTKTGDVHYQTMSEYGH